MDEEKSHFQTQLFSQARRVIQESFPGTCVCLFILVQLLFPCLRGLLWEIDTGILLILCHLIIWVILSSIEGVSDYLVVPTRQFDDPNPSLIFMTSTSNRITIFSAEHDKSHMISILLISLSFLFLRSDIPPGFNSKGPRQASFYFPSVSSSRVHLSFLLLVPSWFEIFL